MPDLKITDGSGRLHPHFGVYLYSVMLAPEGGASFNQILVTTFIQDLYHHALAAGDQSVTLPIDALRTLFARQSIGDVRREIMQRASYGERAGAILGIIVACAEVSPSHASVSRAIDALSKVLTRKGVKPTSPAFLKREWAHYRSVAHLWTALREQVLASDFALFSEGATISSEDAIRVLAVAEQYRARGESIYARGQKKHHGPVLNPNETWKVPADTKLPEVELYDFRVPADVRQAMTEYRAPKKF